MYRVQSFQLRFECLGVYGSFRHPKCKHETRIKPCPQIRSPIRIIRLYLSYLYPYVTPETLKALDLLKRGKKAPRSCEPAQRKPSSPTLAPAGVQLGLGFRVL